MAKRLCANFIHPSSTKDRDMHRMLLTLVAVGLAGTAIGANTKSQTKPETKLELKTEDQKALYALGYAIGGNLGEFYLTAEDLKFVEVGLADKVAQKDSAVESATANQQIQAFQNQRMQMGVTNAHTEGAAYVEKAAAITGAVKLPSGIVIQMIQEGTGASPTANDTVKVQYTGTLINGNKFDSSLDHGGPASFKLNSVIRCWTEGVQQIKAGGKAKLICPADSAYGDRPNHSIPAGSTLIFDVELLEVVKETPQ
jgi:FKBP-type peptidyl-prolyl cis-trans isomerase FkpA